MFFYSWDRNAKYGTPEAPTIVAVAEDPDSYVKVWNTNSVTGPIVTYMSCDAGHMDWLST